MSISTMVLQLAEGMLTSVEIFLLTLLISLPLGIFVALGRMSRLKPLSWLVRIYISIMRGTPLMLQLLVVYFGPYFLFGIQTGANYRFTAVIVAFSVNYAAYFAEIYRGGIASIPAGQYEAAAVLGYSPAQTFTRIVLPQMVKRVLPSVTNEIITLIKDTSLAFAISVSEMFTTAKAIVAAQKSMAAFVAAGLFYYIFNFIVAMLMERAEKRLDYYRI